MYIRSVGKVCTYEQYHCFPQSLHLSISLCKQSITLNSTYCCCCCCCRKFLSSSRPIWRGPSRWESAVSRRTTHSGLGVSHTTVLVIRSRRTDRIVNRRVDSQRNPSENSIFNRVANHDVFDKRIHIRGFLGENRVFGVEGQFLRVARIRFGGFDLGNEVLVEEDLADVRGGGGEVSGIFEQGAVGADDGGVGVVGEDVNVSGTASVVTREGGFELDDTVDVGLLQSAVEGVVEVRSVVGVSVSAGGNARVDASAVAVPGIDVDGGCRGAGGGVDELDIDEERDTGLVLGHVRANQLAIDVVGTLGDFWLQDTAGVVGEEGELVVAVLDSGG